MARLHACLHVVLALLALGSSLVSAQAGAGASTDETAALEQSGIIPDVVDGLSSTCDAELAVSFGGAAIENGQLLAPADAASPNITVTGSSDSLYTVIAVDPDAPMPANPTSAQILHGLWTNIPGDGDAADGTEVTSWAPPQPPAESPPHRYVFLVYQQPGQTPLQVADPSAGEAGRRNFDACEFAAQQGLGQPCDAAWFMARR